MLNDGRYGGDSVIDADLLKSMFKPTRATGDKVHQYGIGFGLGVAVAWAIGVI